MPTLNNHDDYLNYCIELAKTSIEKGGGPFAALVVKDNNIIAQGHNQVTMNHDPTAHAEINAIRAACQVLSDFQLSDCILYSSSEPCPMCLSAIYWSRLPRVYYANDYQQAQRADFDDQFIFQELSLPHHAKRIQLQQTDNPQIRQTAAKIFDIWIAKTDKIAY